MGVFSISEESVTATGWHTLRYSEGRGLVPLTAPTPFGVPQGGPNNHAYVAKKGAILESGRTGERSPHSKLFCDQRSRQSFRASRVRASGGLVNRKDRQGRRRLSRPSKIVKAVEDRQGR